MPPPSIRFTEFVDLLLVRLYELDRERPDDFVNLALVAEQIKADVPATWVIDAARVLETRALADVVYTFGGTDAKISGEGRLYVEEGRGTTKAIQAAPQNFYVQVSGDNNQVVTGSLVGSATQQLTIEQERAPALKLLDDLHRKVTDDQSISGATRMEALTYLGLIQQELKKPEPNRNVIGVVLEPLSKIASIAGGIASLMRLFNASL
jgi:hypothetical protein